MPRAFMSYRCARACATAASSRPGKPQRSGRLPPRAGGQEQRFGRTTSCAEPRCELRWKAVTVLRRDRDDHHASCALRLGDEATAHESNGPQERDWCHEQPPRRCDEGGGEALHLPDLVDDEELGVTPLELRDCHRLELTDVNRIAAHC